MMRNPYQHMADRINRLEPGQALRISAQEIRDLPGLPDWAFMAEITTGFERVKESVIGSAHPDIWQFNVNHYTGDVTCYRLPDRPLRRENSASTLKLRSWDDGSST